MLIQILTFVFALLILIESLYYLTHRHKSFLGFPFNHPTGQNKLCLFWGIVMLILTIIVVITAVINDPVIILWTLAACCLIEVAMSFTTVSLLLKGSVLF